MLWHFDITDENKQFKFTSQLAYLSEWDIIDDLRTEGNYVYQLERNFFKLSHPCAPDDIYIVTYKGTKNGRH